jgi:bifunctional DNA-binding transcriptional regulator/antitoxin component of YhaV-PrlF toxin-antitoxin module
VAEEGIRVRIGAGGRIVLPEHILERMIVDEGDEPVVHAVSDRVLVLEKPKPTELETALEKLRAQMAAKGITHEDVEAALEGARREIYQETYGAAQDAPPAPGGERPATQQDA